MNKRLFGITLAILGFLMYFFAGPSFWSTVGLFNDVVGVFLLIVGLLLILF